MRAKCAISDAFVRACVFAYCPSVAQYVYSLSAEHCFRLRNNAISDERVRDCALSTHSVFRALPSPPLPTPVGHRAGLGAGVRRSAADLPSGSGHVTEDWAGRPVRGEAVVVRCLSETYVCANLILNRYRLNYKVIYRARHLYIPTYLDCWTTQSVPAIPTLERACGVHQITDRLLDLWQGKRGCVSGDPSFLNPPYYHKIDLFSVCPTQLSVQTLAKRLMPHARIKLFLLPCSSPMSAGIRIWSYPVELHC